MVEKTIASAKILEIEFESLFDKTVDLSDVIEQAFGESGNGIVAVSGIPRFYELRMQLLPLAESLAKLSESSKSKLEDAESKYSFGWSHGKEKLEGGTPDTLKGSFYANPILDIPTEDSHLLLRYPSYCRPNIWPKEDLPELESAFKSLGKCLASVGMFLLHHCDKYTLTPPLFSASEKGPQPLESPSDETGLFIRDRQGQVLKVPIPPTCAAFQVGEALQVLSGGLLRATPHCVRAVDGFSGMSRSTFALFMQPKWDEPMDVPQGSGSPSQVGVGQWKSGMTFGDFSEATFAANY